LQGDRALTADLALLQRLERQTHRGFGRGSAVHDTGAFRIYLWPRPEPFYRNRALPMAEPARWQPAIERLVAIFAHAGREPRLEFFAERWPTLPPALQAAGFVLESRAPALVLATPPADTQPAGEILGPGCPPALSATFLAGVQTVFGAPPPTDPGELVQLRRDLEQGVTIAAMLWLDRQPVAGASLIGVGAEAELAGVWTRPEHRRRGHAQAVCARLLRHFFGRGGELVWLSAGGEGSEGLYLKLGFGRVGTQLNYALPASSP
jgi:ribosomal protein S18 acetylase RimI-like enzyme